MQKQLFMKLKMSLRAFIVILFALIFPLKSSFAGQSLNLYDVTLPIADESVLSRNQAFAEGLMQVFIRLSGDSIIATKLKLPAASAYVKQYSYQPVENPPTSDSGELLNFQLTVHYNGSRVADYLRKNGFPIWGQYRARLAVWLVVRDGQHQYILKNSNRSLIKTAVDRALQRRGVAVAWPDYNKQDQKYLSFSDIRGGFRDPLEKASAKYTNGPILSSSFTWNGHNWQTDWTLLFKNTEHRWHSKGQSYNALIQHAIDQIVDTMGQVYAIREMESGQEAEPVYISVRGINNIADYKQVSDYLRSMPVIKRLKIKQVNQTAVEFELDLRSRQQAVLRLLKNEGRLIPVTPPADNSQQAADGVNQVETDSAMTDSTLASQSSAEPAGLESMPVISPHVNTLPQSGATQKINNLVAGNNTSEDIKQVENGSVVTQTAAVIKPVIYYFRLP